MVTVKIDLGVLRLLLFLLHIRGWLAAVVGVVGLCSWDLLPIRLLLKDWVTGERHPLLDQGHHGLALEEADPASSGKALGKDIVDALDALLHQLYLGKALAVGLDPVEAAAVVPLRGGPEDLDAVEVRAVRKVVDDPEVGVATHHVRPEGLGAMNTGHVHEDRHLLLGRDPLPQLLEVGAHVIAVEAPGLPAELLVLEVHLASVHGDGAKYCYHSSLAPTSVLTEGLASWRPVLAVVLVGGEGALVDLDDLVPKT